MSVWHTPHATSRTSTSPGPGSASSTSCTTSGSAELLEHRRADLHRRRPRPTRASSSSSPASVWLVAVRDLARRVSSPGAREPLKLTTLLWRVRPRSRSGSVRERPFDEHLERAPDEALRALARAALDELDEPLHALRPSPDAARRLLESAGRLGAAPRREDERERAVVADLLDDLERLCEVLLGLAREADDDVGA